ncbi:MAG: polysaccharide biosynthesis protein, partial [Desulfovibrio sp.]|nr:polysaccharide biosynthesis protein [Desulfovibrio sp.]
MKLKDIPRRLGYILGAQWTRDVSWTAFTILLARHSPDVLGQIVLALTYGYLVKTVADVGLNDFLLSTFARGRTHPRSLLREVSWLKLAVWIAAMAVTWIITGVQGYSFELRLVVLCIAGGLGLDAVSDSFFALCQARGRQDVEMRIRIPSALAGIGYGIVCVVMNAPPIAIALYKPVESLLCIAFARAALHFNPLADVG